MAAVVLDTDAASLLHKDRLPPDVEGLLLGNVVCVTFVTEAELFKWAEVRNWGERRRRELDAWLSNHVVTLPSDHQTAKTWGALAARARKRGRPRPVNDTWVAACCIARDLPLITFNRRDFLDFQEHDGLVLLTE
jgi:toxin FitB